MSELAFCVEATEIGERLDKVVAQRTALSRTQVQQLIKDGTVLVNATPSKPAYRLEDGDCVYLTLPTQADVVLEPEDVALDVLYEDEDMAVINKPAGMVVHPGPGSETGTLVNALLARWPAIGSVGNEPERAGIVHRLDKDTSGVIAVALNDDARQRLMEQFQARTVEKHYIALAERIPASERGRIDAPIGRDPRHRKRMTVLQTGKPATTEFYVREYYSERALLDVFPKTGRTHQIRVHLAYIGCPIVGDMIYGYRKQRIKMKRLFLHAYRISLDHPASGERLTLTSPLPAGLQNILDKLKTG